MCYYIIISKTVGRVKSLEHSLLKISYPIRYFFQNTSPTLEKKVKYYQTLV